MENIGKSKEKIVECKAWFHCKRDQICEFEGKMWKDGEVIGGEEGHYQRKHQSPLSMNVEVTISESISDEWGCMNTSNYSMHCNGSRSGNSYVTKCAYPVLYWAPYYTGPCGLSFSFQYSLLPSLCNFYKRWISVVDVNDESTPLKLADVLWNGTLS